MKQEDAEDLTSDIVPAILQSADKIRDDNVFSDVFGKLPPIPIGSSCGKRAGCPVPKFRKNLASPRKENLEKRVLNLRHSEQEGRITPERAYAFSGGMAFL